MKLYFIAAGHSRDIVLKEVKGYPMHFCRALEYIAQRMNSAATTSLRSASVGQTPEVVVNPFTPLQSTTFKTVPFSSPVASEGQANTVCSTAEDTSSHGTKRPAERDAEIEHLVRALVE